MRFESIDRNTQHWVEIYYEGPATREELDKLRQKASEHANKRLLEPGELEMVHQTVERARGIISPEDQPQVVIGDYTARVLVRPEDVIEIYGHGLVRQAQILYPRTEAVAAQAQIARFPGSKAIITYSVNF